ncbi:MAG: UDP-N-acetylmuramate--L-alanine ligase [Magnetococcales bacterium]|nr:UDP-N-acetylmuramate--L-alanine ligase [Magnetococcales bacterium]
MNNPVRRTCFSSGRRLEVAVFKSIRHIHFVGIGGIGMSGIAEVLLTMGCRISGSDLSENANAKRLKALGATIYLGHQASQVAGCQAVVYSSAVSRDNPEVVEARRLHIPVVARAEMLAELMRLKHSIAIAGTHGKTTTTSLVATLLVEGGLDPTVVNGGIVKALGSNARLGSGDFLVTEADESDGSFTKLLPSIAVVTNIDAEHMEHYGTFDAVRKAFHEFASRIPFYGLAVLCRDHPEVAGLAASLPDKRVVTYGFGPDADLQAVDIRQEGIRTRFRVLRHDQPHQRTEDLGEMETSLAGRHNVHNALAAIAVARELSIPWVAVRHALSHFRGVQRRFDLLWEDENRLVIDDYAHHPTEINATLEAARGSCGDRRLVAFFQPHRYTRVRDHYEEFLQAFRLADQVVVDRIYPAGETPPPGLLESRGPEAMCRGIQAQSHVPCRIMPEGTEPYEALDALLGEDAVALFLGAGDITRLAKGYAAWRQKQRETA